MRIHACGRVSVFDMVVSVDVMVAQTAPYMQMFGLCGCEGCCFAVAKE